MQVGIVLLMSLATKNAIFIVKFVKDQREQAGLSIVDAASLRSRGTAVFRLMAPFSSTWSTP
jgi:multidrug efflux pump subunit AcrB